MYHRQQTPNESWFAIAVAGAVLALAMVVSTYASPRHKPYVLAFTAKWCAQCQIDKKLYPKLQAKRGPLYVIDYDANPELVKRWGVTALPMYIHVRADGSSVSTKDIRVML